MISLSNKLKELANNLGITHVEAAKRCGLDRRRYGHYVTGRSRPNYETLLIICKNLGATPNILLDYSGTNESVEIQQLLSICDRLNPDEIKFLIATAQTLSKKKHDI